MERRLKDVAEDLHVHYEEGQGHWWDGDAGARRRLRRLARLLRDVPAQRGSPMAPRDLDVTFADLSLDADHHWVSVEQPLQYGAPMRVKAHLDAATGRRSSSRRRTSAASSGRRRRPGASEDRAPRRQDAPLPGRGRTAARTRLVADEA